MRTEKHLPDGREIIAREQAMGRHPHPSQKNRLVPYNGVTKLLITDGTEIYECDRCGYASDSTESVAAHMPSHTERGPDTPIGTIKTVLRVVAHARQEHGRHALPHAVEELNRRNVAPARGTTWTVGSVGALERAYKDVYPVRVRRSTPKVLAGAAADTAVAEQPVTNTLVDMMGDLIKRATDLNREVIALAKKVDKVANAQAIDPEILEKAAKYDQFRNLMQD